MDKKTKGLADTGEGEFLLNESGTSVSTDRIEPSVAETPEKPTAASDTLDSAPE
ncbi:MAG: hypothetical protein H0X41_11160 [Chitinophagaceae bacterium]|nr:hypothetical protein [Chitinophagaceae bacterium]